MMLSKSNVSGSNYRLYTAADLASWGSTGGKGAIRARTSLASDGTINLAGATVTATSTLNPARTYTYVYDGGGSATNSTGYFTIPNVDEGDIVVVTAAKAGYTFEPRTYITHNGAVSANRLKGSLLAPTITGFSPGSGHPGEWVTIDGDNFDPAPDGNTVRFNGTTAVVTEASPTQLTAIVPPGATSGPISVTLAASGATATSAGSFTITAASSYNLFLSQTGYGNGSVTCNGGACAPSYSPGTAVTMGNVPNAANSVFGGWSGACTGAGGCTVVMNQDQFLTATFDLMPVMLPAYGMYFPNLQAVPASGPWTGEVWEQTGTDIATVMNTDGLIVTLKGGFNADFSQQTGYTTFVTTLGPSTIAKGCLIADRIIIK
jgi:hypothetical protein